jgi:hypothetical protein
MSLTAADGFPAGALPGERDEQAHDAGPDGGAAEDAQHEAEVRPAARLGGRGHAATILLCLVVVQVTWLAALLYGVYALLR